MSRPIKRSLLVGTIASLLLAACTSETPAADPSPSTSPTTQSASASASSTETTSPTETPNEQRSDFFVSGTAASVVPWWNDHPQLAPLGQQSFNLLYNEKLSGPQVVNNLDIAGKIARVIVTCASTAPYSVGFGPQSNPALINTSGTSCGGPAIPSYDTPALSTDSNTVSVVVPEGTNYYLTIFLHN